MEQWDSLHIVGAQRSAVKNSLLDNMYWVGAPIRHDRPRVVIAHCVTTIHKDLIFTEYTAEILKYGREGLLQSFWTCSVLIPNRLLAGLTSDFVATLSHVYFHEVDQRVMRVDIEQGGCFARPTLRNPHCAIDLFAGLGGWAIGQEWAIEATGKVAPLITASIDYNRSTAKASADLMGGTFWERNNFLSEANAQFDQGQHFIHAKVGDRNVQQKLSEWNFAVAVASPSCQPWSSASTQNGLAAELGFNFCELNNYVCAMQPCLLALENVKGLQSHPHFGFLVQILEHNGLRLIHQEIQTARKWLPTERSRLFCIFKRLDWSCTFEQIAALQKISMPLNSKLEKIDRYLSEDYSGDQDFLKPTHQELQNLANPAFFPGTFANMNQLKVLAARNVATKEQFGPIMASYRSNVSFQESFLRDNKLFADIKCNNGTYLFLHPLEIAAALGMPKKVRGMNFAVPDEPSEAFRMLGNMYVPFQSGQAWIKIYCLLNPMTVVCMQEVGLLWKSYMIDFSDCQIRHVDNLYLVIQGSSDIGEQCVPTQKFAYWKGTSRLVYDASLDDETLHHQICPCEEPGSKECALQTGRVSVSGADGNGAEAITFLFAGRTVVVNRCNLPNRIVEFGTFFGTSISTITVDALNRHEIAPKTISGRIILHPNQPLPGVVIMTPTVGSARELKEDVTFGKGDDCITVKCKQLNPERIHELTQQIGATVLAELSGWHFQTMCDPYDAKIQQLQIRPRPRCWSLQHDEFEYLLHIHMWTLVCKTIGQTKQSTNSNINFLGHEIWIAFDDVAVLSACVQMFNRIFPYHQPVHIASYKDGSWAIARTIDGSAQRSQACFSCDDSLTRKISRPAVEHLTAGPLILHFKTGGAGFQAKLYDERGSQDLNRLRKADVNLALENKGIAVRLEHIAGEKLAMIEVKTGINHARTIVLDELAHSYLLGFAQMWRRMSNQPLCTCTIVWISGLRTIFTVPTDTSFDQIQLAWRFANKWFGADSQVRFVIGGKQIMPQIRIGEVGQANQKIHVVLPLQGGGVKADRTVTVKNNLARWMLLQGVALDKVTSVLDTLQKQAGQQQLLFLDQQDGSKRWEHLQAICAKVNIECPKPDPKPELARLRSTKLQAKDHTKSLDIANSTLEPGFFITLDDKPAAILKHVVVKGTGVCMTTASEASQWLQDTAPISGDPKSRKSALASRTGFVVMSSHSSCLNSSLYNPKRTCDSVSRSISLLCIAAILTSVCPSWYILVETRIALPCGSRIGTVTVWCCLSGWTCWSDGIKTARGWNANFSKVWGRRYISKNNQVQPRAMIPSGTEEDILRLSGAKGLYTVSFEGEGKPKTQYKIVWVVGSKQDLLVRSASLQSHGVIRNKTGFGLRVSRDSYENAFKGLRPGEDIPEEFDANHKWKIESLPFGTTSDGLKDWAVSIGWAIKPLKFLGPRAAILLSTTTPPEGILSINGTPILLRALDTKKKTIGSLIAGPPQKRTTSESNDVDCLQTNDPWARSSAPSTSSDTRPPLMDQSNSSSRSTKARFRA